MRGIRRVVILTVGVSLVLLGLSTAQDIVMENSDATTNAVVDVVNIKKDTTGTPAAGIGAGLTFNVEDAGGSEEQASIDVILDDVTNASEDATMAFSVNQGGTITEIMRIDGTAGHVGIGTTSPSELVEVSGPDTINPTIMVTRSSGDFGDMMLRLTESNYRGGYLRYDGDVNDFYIGVHDPDDSTAGNDTDAITIDRGTARVGIGRTPTANALEVSGDASKTSSGSWLANSDRRIKTEVCDLEDALATILELRPVSFRYTEEYLAEHPEIRDRDYLNFIAQEFQEVFPDEVKDDGTGLLQIDIHAVTPTLVSAVQELTQLVEGLKSENARLRARVENLERRAAGAGR